MVHRCASPPVYRSLRPGRGRFQKAARPPRRQDAILMFQPLTASIQLLDLKLQDATGHSSLPTDNPHYGCRRPADGWLRHSVRDRPTRGRALWALALVLVLVIGVVEFAALRG